MLKCYLFLSLLAIGSLVSAGTPGEDPQVLAVREQFLQAHMPLFTDFPTDSHWSCTLYSVLRGTHFVSSGKDHIKEIEGSLYLNSDSADEKHVVKYDQTGLGYILPDLYAEWTYAREIARLLNKSTMVVEVSFLAADFDKAPKGSIIPERAIFPSDTDWRYRVVHYDVCTLL